MKISWRGSTCIFCCDEKPLEKEHIIPSSLGGTLTAKFLCKNCNNTFGHDVEASAKKAPEIRRAIGHLKQDLPDLFHKIEIGQRYVSQFGSERLIQRLGFDGVLGENKLADGSLILPEERARKHLKKILSKAGKSDAEVDDAITRWETADPETIIKLTSDTNLKKWENIPAVPNLDGAEFNPLIILKISYEFTALLVGNAIFDNCFDPIRKILNDRNENAASNLVLRLEADKYAPFHGVCFEGNLPTARFQVRLFGKLAYRVSFPNIGVAIEPTVYTLDLRSNRHDVRNT